MSIKLMTLIYCNTLTSLVKVCSWVEGSEEVKYINWILCICRVIPEMGVSSEDPSSVKKIVFCTGKVFYDIRKARAAKGLDKEIAIARVEQVRIVAAR